MQSLTHRVAFSARTAAIGNTSVPIKTCARTLSKTTCAAFCTVKTAAEVVTTPLVNACTPAIETGPAQF